VVASKPYKPEGHRPRPAGLDPRAAVRRRWHVHGPQPRDYAQRTPKKMKAAALRGALSDRARHGRIHVVDRRSSTGTRPRRQGGRQRCSPGSPTAPNLLVVLDRADQVVSLKSVRNLDNVHVLAVDQLNTYDVLCADDVVFTAGAPGDVRVAAPVAAAARPRPPS
jgi:large subunit ribosomal protein L4